MARQRSREAYLDKPSTGNGVLKSTQDRLNGGTSGANKFTDGAPATDRPSMRAKGSYSHRRGNSRQDSESRALGTHDEKRLRRIGITSVDGTSESANGIQAKEEERGYVDVLSRSVSPAEDDQENPSSCSDRSLQGY